MLAEKNLIFSYVYIRSGYVSTAVATDKGYRHKQLWPRRHAAISKLETGVSQGRAEQMFVRHVWACTKGLSGRYAASP